MKRSIVIALLAGLVACGESTVPHFRRPTVDAAFEALTADGGEGISTSTLTLTFDTEIEGLSADDFYIWAGTTGTLKKELVAVGQGVYELAVRRVYAPGEIIVNVAKEGYLFAPYEQKVEVFGAVIPVTWEPIAQDGDQNTPTRSLTFALDGDVGEEITEADFTVAAGDTGTEKGALTYLGEGRYALELRNIGTDGEVTIDVEKEGYEFTPATQTTVVYHWLTATWNGLTADGESGKQTTAKLTFEFDRDLDGFSVDDITLTAGKTGALAGELTALGDGVYELTLTDIVESGTITVSVYCSGYTITPASQPVVIYYVAPKTK